MKPYHLPLSTYPKTHARRALLLSNKLSHHHNPHSAYIRNHPKPTIPLSETACNHFFDRINQLLTTPNQLFRKSPLAAPKSPPTFAVPKRQTDQRKSPKHSLRHKIERSGTPAETSLSTLRSQLQASRFISQIACTSEKNRRTFATRFNRKQPDLENPNEKN